MNEDQPLYKVVSSVTAVGRRTADGWVMDWERDNEDGSHEEGVMPMSAIFAGWVTDALDALEREL